MLSASSIYDLDVGSAIEQRRPKTLEGKTLGAGRAPIKFFRRDAENSLPLRAESGNRCRSRTRMVGETLDTGASIVSSTFRRESLPSFEEASEGLPHGSQPPFAGEGRTDSFAALVWSHVII